MAEEEEAEEEEEEAETRTVIVEMEINFSCEARSCARLPSAGFRSDLISPKMGQLDTS